MKSGSAMKICHVAIPADVSLLSLKFRPEKRKQRFAT